MTIFYCLRSETPPNRSPGSRIYIPQEQAGSVITPGTGLPFRRFHDSQGYGGGNSEPSATPWRASLLSLAAQIRGGPNKKDSTADF
jgi:hypothetical protein